MRILMALIVPLIGALSFKFRLVRFMVSARFKLQMGIFFPVFKLTSRGNHLHGSPLIFGKANIENGI